MFEERVGSDRQSAIDAVVKRLEAMSRTQEEAEIVSAAALRDAEQLRRTLIDLPSDPEGAHALGWFHWYGYLLSEGDDRLSHLDQAWAAFEAVHSMQPDVVPPEFQAAFVYTRRNGALSDVHAEDKRDFILNIVGDRAWSLVSRSFLRAGDAAALFEAVRMQRLLLGSTAPDSSLHLASLNNLANALGAVFEMTGDVSLLNESIALISASTLRTPPGHPDEASRHNNLGIAFTRRYKVTGDPANLDRAIEASRASLTRTPAHSPEKPSRLSNLSNHLLDRYQHSASVTDLDEAVALARQAVELARPSRNKDLSTCLNNLSQALMAHFKATRVTSDVQEAIGRLREALMLIEPSLSYYGTFTHNLGDALGEWAALTGDASAWEEMVSIARRGLAESPPGHPDHLNRLKGLATALRSRFEATADVADLEESIAFSRQVVAEYEGPATGRVSALNSLFLSLWAHHLRTGNFPSLQEAITALEQASALLPPLHHSRAMICSNLGSAWYAVYQRTGDPKALSSAVECGRESVKLTPLMHGVDRAAHLSNLSGALLQLFEMSGDRALLDEAVTTAEEAVAGMEALGTWYATVLNTLSRALQRRAAIEPDEENVALHAALEAARASVAASTSVDPHRVVYLTNLCTCLWETHVASPSEPLLTEIDAYGAEAASLRLASPVWRVRAARIAGIATATAASWPKALAHYTCAVNLLAEVVTRQLSRPDREHGLVQVPTVAAEAGAVALTAGQPEAAVALLERGRALMHSQNLDLRSDLQALREAAPGLVDRLGQVASELARAEEQLAY
ncbi:hypothetical protein ACIRQQ_15795 [Streptomyces fuscichromogenes]|uniref:hypothetical protein n=1 Tax=Streptomyces fuscichromogenes TaxID=1324013 RepID=UPI003819F79D